MVYRFSLLFPTDFLISTLASVIIGYKDKHRLETAASPRLPALPTLSWLLAVLLRPKVLFVDPNSRRGTLTEPASLHVAIILTQ